MIGAMVYVTLYETFLVTAVSAKLKQFPKEVKHENVAMTSGGA